MKVTLLGFTLASEDLDEIVRTDASMPIQTHVFAWSLVEALRAAAMDVTLLSSAPVSNYPGNSQILFRGKHFTADRLQGELLGFINVVVLKHLSRFGTCLGRGTRALRRWHPDVLLIHGVHSPYLWYGVIARNLSRARTVVVLTDPPGVLLPSDGLIARTLKRLDIRLVRWALRWVDGIIALTAPLATDFAPKTPSLVMEGILGSGVAEEPLAAKHNGLRVVYAGALLSEYGVDRLVKAVRNMPRTDIRLTTLGKGPLASWIDAQAAADPRIEKTQFVPRETVLASYTTAAVLVQPRPVDQEFVRYSFPSKLLEYMASGTPVLSTRLSGIPVEYDPFVYWIDDDTPDGIKAALAGVLAVSSEERHAKGRAAADFIKNTRSSGAQGGRIHTFLKGLVGPQISSPDR